MWSLLWMVNSHGLSLNSPVLSQVTGQEKSRKTPWRSITSFACQSKEILKRSYCQSQSQCSWVKGTFSTASTPNATSEWNELKAGEWGSNIITHQMAYKKINLTNDDVEESSASKFEWVQWTIFNWVEMKCWVLLRNYSPSFYNLQLQL